MIHTKPALFLLLTALIAPLATAQAQLPLALTPSASTKPATPTNTTPSTTGAPAEPTPASSITPEQARQALDVLNDPAKRAAIAATLETIARAQPATAKPSAPAAASATQPASTLGIPLAPGSLGAAVLVGGANAVTAATDRVSEVLHTAHGLPALWSWLITMATDPVAQTLLIALAWRLVVAVAVSAAAMWCIARALRRPLRQVCRRIMRLPPAAARRTEAEPTAPPAANRTADRATPGDPDRADALDPDDSNDDPNDDPDDAAEDPEESAEARAEHGEFEPPARRRFDPARLLRRVPLVVAEVALYLLPILGFVVVGHVLAGSALGDTNSTRLVLLAVIDSYALCAAMLRLADALLAPRHRRLRLLPVGNATAAYAMRWTRRILVVGVLGYAATEVGLLLGLTAVAHLALLKATVLVLHIFVAIIIVQKRRVVRRWIRAPADRQGIVAGIRNRFAAIWHWIALFYLAALWLVWAAALPAGYERVSRVVLVAVGVAFVGRIIAQACIAALNRLLRAGSELSTQYPGLDGRLSFYHPFLLTFVRIAVWLLAVLLFLQLLGVGAFLWLVASPLGQRISGSAIALAVTLLLALLAWEAVNIAIERHLARLTQHAQIASAARLRTLLPFLRAALVTLIATITVLMVLSEVGVNTAPLLASAGIIGVAIGFGSQKLVQDLITGLFLLLENAMQVGDFVTVSGLSGTVEHLSVRTIRLRAGDGSVHIIPFSAVTSVTNTNRGQGNAAVSVTVAHHEDTDRVCEVLRGIATELRAMPEYAAGMLSELQLWGVDRVDGASATITGQIVCTDTGRWAVQREFNRRVKKRFEEREIQLFNPTRSLMVPADGFDRTNPSPEPGTKPSPEPATKPSPEPPALPRPSGEPPALPLPSGEVGARQRSG